MASSWRPSTSRFECSAWYHSCIPSCSSSSMRLTQASAATQEQPAAASSHRRIGTGLPFLTLAPAAIAAAAILGTVLQDAILHLSLSRLPSSSCALCCAESLFCSCAGRAREGVL